MKDVEPYYFDEARRGARAAAWRLADEYGATLPAEVEAALNAPTADRSIQYFDPVAVSALIVAAAQLAWTAYRDLREGRSKPPTPEAVTRAVRVELSNRTEINAEDRNRVIEVVVQETLSPPPEMP